MAEYRIYRDFGDFGTELTCSAPCLRSVLNRIVKGSSDRITSEFTVRTGGECIAHVNIDAHGNYTAEVLECRHFPVDVAYSVGSWSTYWLNSDKEWIKGGAEAYSCNDD